MLGAKQQRGFTIIELLVTVAVSLIVLSGVITVFVATLTSSADTLRMARLNQELRAIMDIMVHDVRRAGYAGTQPGADNDQDGDVDQDDLAFNPFTDGNYDLQIIGSCIAYSYNLDEDSPPCIGVGGGNTTTCTKAGSYKDTANNELFGFKLDGNAIKMRTGGNTPGCNSGTWESISSEDISISALTLTPTTSTLNISNPGNACASGNACQDIRSIEITITGSVVDGLGTVISQQTINDIVRVRNDRYYVAP